MSTQEHLVENILHYVESKGWEAFPDYLEPGEITDETRAVPCADEASDEVLAWLVTMARYVVYQKDVWN